MGSREQFEAWWRSEMNIEVMGLHRCEFPMQKPDFVQPYACHETQRAWLAWEASRKAAAAALRDKAEKEWLGSRGYHSGWIGAALHIEGLPKC